jgi:hypothetical protein
VSGGGGGGSRNCNVTRALKFLPRNSVNLGGPCFERENKQNIGLSLRHNRFVRREAESLNRKDTELRC